MHDHKKIIDKLRPFARRTDIERVEQAVQALRAFGDEAVLALAVASCDTEDYIRVMALEILYEWDGDTVSVLPAVIRALDDSDRIVRICAASVVSLHVEKASEAVPRLAEWLEGDDEHSRLTAAALILRIDPTQNDEMVTVLAEGMQSDDSAIRCLTAWLLSGLMDMTPDARPLLQIMLDDEDEFVRSVVEEELASHD